MQGRYRPNPPSNQPTPKLTKRNMGGEGRKKSNGGKNCTNALPLTCACTKNIIQIIQENGREPPLSTPGRPCPGRPAWENPSGWSSALLPGWWDPMLRCTHPRAAQEAGAPPCLGATIRLRQGAHGGSVHGGIVHPKKLSSQYISIGI